MSDEIVKPTCAYYGENNDIHALIGCVLRVLDAAGMEKEKREYMRLVARDGNMMDAAFKISSDYVEFIDV